MPEPLHKQCKQCGTNSRCACTVETGCNKPLEGTPQACSIYHVLLQNRLLQNREQHRLCHMLTLLHKDGGALGGVGAIEAAGQAAEGLCALRTDRTTKSTQSTSPRSHICVWPPAFFICLHRMCTALSGTLHVSGRNLALGQPQVGCRAPCQGTPAWQRKLMPAVVLHWPCSHNARHKAACTMLTSETWSSSWHTHDKTAGLAH